MSDVCVGAFFQGTVFREDSPAPRAVSRSLVLQSASFFFLSRLRVFPQFFCAVAVVRHVPRLRLSEKVVASTPPGRGVTVVASPEAVVASTPPDKKVVDVPPCP